MLENAQKTAQTQKCGYVGGNSGYTWTDKISEQAKVLQEYMNIFKIQREKLLKELEELRIDREFVMSGF